MRELILILTISFLICSCSGKRTEQNAPVDSLNNQKVLAVSSIKRNNYQQAIEEITKAEAIDPKDPDVHLIKGVIYFQLKDYAKSETSYKQALALKPDYSEARYNLCTLYLAIEKPDAAIVECGKAASDPLYKSRDKAYTSLGVAYFRRGDLDRAGESYQKALEINPAFVYTHNEIGKLYMAMGRDREAIEEFTKAIDGFSLYDEAHYNLGLAYLKAGETNKACESFRKVVDISPGSSFAVNSTSYLRSVCQETTQTE